MKKRVRVYDSFKELDKKTYKREDKELVISKEKNANGTFRISFNANNVVIRGFTTKKQEEINKTWDKL